MKGYKGFEKGLICKGKQYAENTVFEEDSAEICKSGMHFCDLPHNVFQYYSPGENHEFAEVEALDDVQTDDDIKYCTKKLKIGAKISVFDICKMSVSAAFKKFEFDKKINEAKESPDNNSGYCGASNSGDCGASNSGDYGASNSGDHGASNSGDYGASNSGDYGASNSGDCGASNSGDCGASNSGDCGASNSGDHGASNSGYCGASNSGDYGASNSGDCGASNSGYCGASNSGYCGASNSGDYGAAIVRKEGTASVGRNGVAIGLGNGSMAKGKKNSVLVLVEYDDNGDISHYKAVKVDGKKILEDTYYTLKNGKLTKVK